MQYFRLEKNRYYSRIVFVVISKLWRSEEKLTQALKSSLVPIQAELPPRHAHPQSFHDLPVNEHYLFIKRYLNRVKDLGKPVVVQYKTSEIRFQLQT